jgi:hypothetical protein
MAGGLLTASLAVGCAGADSSDEGVTCGEGTVQEGNVCVAVDQGVGGGGSGGSSGSSGSSGSGSSSSGSSGDCIHETTQPCYSGPAGTESVGACHAGTQTCADGDWGPCVGEVTPSAEACDALDNDCDGQVDNGNPGGDQACSTGNPGVCAAGTTACAGGQLACNQSAQPAAELCDGLDNNCDGEIDNGNPGGNQACSTGKPGVCATGITACAGGQLACNQSAQPSSETCDAIDNNCNGITDDGCAVANSSYVQFVSPYVGLANQPGTLILRGTNFSGAGPSIVVVVGGTELAPVAPDSNTQVTVSYPALPVGQYPVSIKGSTNMPSTNAELVVLAPPAMSPHVISAPSPRDRLVYDAERNTLYAVNPIDQQIERFHYSANSWTALQPYVLPELTDIGLAPNGRSLIVLSDGAIHDIQLNVPPPFVAVERALNPDSFCGQYLSNMAITNDGKALIASHYASCSGSSYSYLYNILNYSVTAGPYPQGHLYNGILGGSLDGSRIYMGENGLSPAQPVNIFNSLTGTITSGPVNYNLSAVTVSANASRVILQQKEVYSRSLSLTGHLPAGGVTLASRDSSKAFVYRDDGGQPRIVVHDLNGQLLPGAIYPTLKTVNLPASPNAAGGTYYDISMAATPDDATVFVSGNSNIIVMPVN